MTYLLVVLIMFVKTGEFISQDMVHTCVVRYEDHIIQGYMLVKDWED